MPPDPNHAEIFRSGPAAWNAWREKNPSTVPELAGIALRLSERQMGPINGGPVNLKSARLQDAVWRFATLSAAELEAADMSGADLMHARFDHANLSAANLSSALLDHADFAGANLTKVNLCGASLSFAIMSTADLEGADMSGADLKQARFDRANLSAANLSNALLGHADFAGANLTKVNLSGANLDHAKNLTRAQLEESIGSDSTILPPHLRGSVWWSTVDRTAIVPLDTSGAQRESEQSLDEPKLSLGTEDQGLPPSAQEKAAAEPRPSAKPEPTPSAASAVDRTETVPPDTGDRGAQEKAAAEPSSANSDVSPPPPAASTVDRTEAGPHTSGAQRESEDATSQTKTTALERHDLGPRARYKADVDVPHIGSYNRPAWIAGVLLIGGVLFTTAFISQHINEVVPSDTLGAQRGGSEQSGVQGVRPSAQEKAAGEPRSSADSDVSPPPPAASTVDRTEAVPLDTSGAKQSEDQGLQPSAAAEPRPSADAEVPPTPSAARTAGGTESRPEQRSAPETDRANVSQETDDHAELQASEGAKPSQESFEPDEHALGAAEEGHSEALEPSALVSAESPVTTSRHGTVPEVPAIPEPQLSDTVSPPIATAALPSFMEQKDAETALPHDAGTCPIPVRKPVIQKREVIPNPDGAQTTPRSIRKSVTQKGSRPAKRQSFADKKAEQRPGGSPADLLAGGL